MPLEMFHLLLFMSALTNLMKMTNLRKLAKILKMHYPRVVALLRFLLKIAILQGVEWHPLARNISSDDRLVREPRVTTFHLYIFM